MHAQIHVHCVHTHHTDPALVKGVKVAAIRPVTVNPETCTMWYAGYLNTHRVG